MPASQLSHAYLNKTKMAVHVPSSNYWLLNGPTQTNVAESFKPNLRYNITNNHMTQKLATVQSNL